MNLDDSVRYLKGVGPKRADTLEKAGIATVGDLLFRLPFRYEDRRQIDTVATAEPGGEVTLVGKISGVRLIRMRGGRRTMLRALFSDDGGWVDLVWFHQAAYFRDRLAEGERWLVHGRLERGARGGVQIVHPEIESADDEESSQSLARILPVYQKPGDLAVAAMRSLIARSVEACAASAQSVVPAPLCERLGIGSMAEALRYVHAPPPDADLDALEDCATPAHRTLILDELFALQVGMMLRKAERAAREGLSMPRADERVAAWLGTLPFEPTGAQRRVIGEIADDMAAVQPMHRLVHGDVGSGKTVVAFAAILQAVAAGRQAALMAPTELLAEQHFRNVVPWAESQGLSVELLTGKLKAAQARHVRELLAGGMVDIVVGTHALVQEATEIPRLGLAVVDEQHRFGVLQRAALTAGDADTLLLSATPIPRTLSLTLFGDVDVSFLDELPPGRTPIVTRLLRPSARAKLYERMAAAVAEGRQCYVVYPLVEESEKSDLADATSRAKELQKGPFRDCRVGLLHGRMKASEKDAVMRRFQAGELDVLVSTTVIEVGIDVPNAVIMVVEHAERFGLAQLHQLRGRVGRGSEDSFCCLVAGDAQSREAYERLRIMEKTTDGFEIAEADLKLRGPGEYLGTKQSGAPAFRAANLVRDGELLELARAEAEAWLLEDPSLTRPESAALAGAIRERWGDRLHLAEVG